MDIESRRPQWKDVKRKKQDSQQPKTTSSAKWKLVWKTSDLIKW